MVTRREMLFAVAIGSLVGCNKSRPGKEALRHSQAGEFLLASEPTGAVGVSEAKDAIATNSEIVLIGRIQGGEIEPWSKGRAAFLLSDATASIDLDESEHQHAPGHDHENCPFCNRNKSSVDSRAIVQFLGDDGQVLPVDVRELFPVSEGQLVVVQGRGKLDSLGTVVVAAEGIYLRR